MCSQLTFEKYLPHGVQLKGVLGWQAGISGHPLAMGRQRLPEAGCDGEGHSRLLRGDSCLWLHSPSCRLQLSQDISNIWATVSPPERSGRGTRQGLVVSQREANACSHSAQHFLWLCTVIHWSTLSLQSGRQRSLLMLWEYFRLDWNGTLCVRISLARMLSWTATGSPPPAELFISTNSCRRWTPRPATTPVRSSTAGRLAGERARRAVSLGPASLPARILLHRAGAGRAGGTFGVCWTGAAGPEPCL